MCRDMGQTQRAEQKMSLAPNAIEALLPEQHIFSSLNSHHIFYPFDWQSRSHSRPSKPLYPAITSFPGQSAPPRSICQQNIRIIIIIRNNNKKENHFSHNASLSHESPPPALCATAVSLSHPLPSPAQQMFRMLLLHHHVGCELKVVAPDEKAPFNLNYRCCSDL